MIRTQTSTAYPPAPAGIPALPPHVPRTSQTEAVDWQRLEREVVRSFGESALCVHNP